MSAAEITQAPEAVSGQRLYLARQLYRTYETSRAELAKLLYEEREARRSEGGRGNIGFKTWLEQAGIPRARAYRLIAEHEMAAGMKEPEPPEPVSSETGSEYGFEEFVAEALAIVREGQKELAKRCAPSSEDMQVLNAAALLLRRWISEALVHAVTRRVGQ